MQHKGQRSGDEVGRLHPKGLLQLGHGGVVVGRAWGRGDLDLPTVGGRLKGGSQSAGHRRRDLARLILARAREGGLLCSKVHPLGALEGTAGRRCARATGLRDVLVLPRARQGHCQGLASEALPAHLVGKVAQDASGFGRGRREVSVHPRDVRSRALLEGGHPHVQALQVLGDVAHWPHQAVVVVAGAWRGLVAWVLQAEAGGPEGRAGALALVGQVSGFVLPWARKL
mmetsp:Transcript_65294/g.155881  ORF Transcript_65294/g.155881 Transcript_65294/m.155881 type:complete len:228 (+) Transcript_65294:56-739(+)